MPSEKRHRSKKHAAAVARKPTHWMVLVKGTYQAQGAGGASGLTKAMNEAKLHLVAFKEAFPVIPSVEDATIWVQSKIAPAPPVEPSA